MFARKLRVLIRSRPEAVVRADDPDAVFVVHLPRAGGHRPQVKNRLDIGLLKVDARRRLLLFEGTQERWVIPAEGVLSCELEECAEPGRGENGPPPLVILLANIAGQVWEGPLRPRPVRFAVPPDSELRRMAVELCAAVRAVSPGAAAPRG
jgi:hypothetical protein